MRAIVRLMTVPEEKRDTAWLADALQAAVQLELSTIPPYLYAFWSVTGSDPQNVSGVLREIAVEEMHHMGIACNLLGAIGLKADIVAAASTYPAVLPKQVHEGLTVNLEPLTKDVLLKKFMVIEEPDAHLVKDPDFQPSGSLLIGQFYDSILKMFESEQPVKPGGKQVSLSDLGFASVPEFPDDSYVIDTSDMATAAKQVKAAIGLIKRQGEGTADSPLEDPANPNELGHFFQFGEIFHGKRLDRKLLTYTGTDVAMPVVNLTMPVNPSGDGSPEAKDFNVAYSNMLRKLQKAWDTGEASALLSAVFSDMASVQSAADALVALNKGPEFLVVDTTGVPPEPVTTTGRFARVKEILDASVGGGMFGAHGPFWRGKSREQFVAAKVFGKQLLVVGNAAESNLVKALRAQAPFGSDTGTVGATFRRMPAGRPAVADADIQFIEQWIQDSCPDDVPVTATPSVSYTTGAQRPDPMVHVAFWREFDDWAMFHASDEVQSVIGVVFGFFPVWQAFAKDPTRVEQWIAALSDAAVTDACAMLSSRQKQTVEAHYGLPVPLLAVLDGFQRFGDNSLPADPLRPEDNRHNMNGSVMWFVWSAFADACVRLKITPEFWMFYMRAILCGMLNDGVFRGRFHVEGFTADSQGTMDIFAYAQHVKDADLAGELRSRYAASGL